MPFYIKHSIYPAIIILLLTIASGIHCIASQNKLDSLLALPLNKMNKVERLNTYYALGQASADSSDNLAIDFYLQGLALTDASTPPEKIAEFHYAIGGIQSRQSDFSEASTSLMRAFEIYDSLGLTNEMGRVSLKIGNLLWYQEKYEAALENYRRAYSYSQQSNDSLAANYALGNMAICLQSLGKYTEALKLHRRKLENSVSHRDSVGIAMAYFNIGASHFSLREYARAMQFYIRASQLSRFMSRDARAKLYSEIGQTCLARGQYQEAEEYLDRAFELADQDDYKKIELEVLFHAARLDSATGDFPDAYLTMKEYDALNREIMSEDIARETNLLESRFRTKLEKKEKEMLRKENALQKAIIDQSLRQRNIIMIFAVALFFLSVVLVYFFLQYRKANRKLSRNNTLLEDQNNRLQNLNASMNRFFSIMAHDIKNPLSTTMGLCGVLHSRFSSLDEEKKLRYIRNIDDSMNYLYKLLENLLQWSRSKTDTMRFEPVLISAEELLDHASSLWGVTAAKKQIELTCKAETGLRIFADMDMISTVLRNLVNNALKYTPQGGKVRVTARKVPENKVRIEVSDTGTGIEPDIVADLFRIEKTVSREGLDGERGTGLGLILCKEFVERNNGTIGVESSPGKGSSFWVDIPDGGMNNQ